MKHSQTLTFTLVWLAYFVVYFLRKPLGVVKPLLAQDLALDKAALGWADVAMLAPYSLVQVRHNHAQPIFQYCVHHVAVSHDRDFRIFH